MWAISFLFFFSLNRRIQTASHPPPLIGQSAPEELVANMSLTSLQSAQSAAQPAPRPDDPTCPTHVGGKQTQARSDRRRLVSCVTSSVRPIFFPSFFCLFVWDGSAFAMARDLLPWGLFRKPLCIQVSSRGNPSSLKKKKKKSRTGNVPSGSVVCVARATASEYTRMLLVDRSDDAADYCW